VVLTIALIPGILLLLYLVNDYTAQQVLQQRAWVSEEFHPYANSLGETIRQKITLLSDFNTFYEQYLPYQMPVAQFNQLASNILTDTASIRYIAVLPDGVYQYIYPLDGNDKLLYLNIFEQVNPNLHIQKDALPRSPELHGPFGQIDSNSEILLSQPIYYQNKFWGVILLSIDPTKLIEKTGLPALNDKYQISLRNSDQTVFYGKEEVFEQYPVIIKIPIEGENWEMAVLPAGGWYKTSSTQTFIIVLGILVLTLSSALVYSTLDRQARLQMDVNERTKEISAELEERKQVENRLRWVNRSLSALNQCNQLMGKISDPVELLQDVCDLLVGIGGYDCVWAGAAEVTPGYPITIMASSGSSHAYIESLQLSWKEEGTGLGPSGRAVRAGKVIISDDIQSDATFSYKSQAAEAGFSSSISIPIMEDHQTWGVFSAYADSRGLIDPQEREILTTLVGNVAYAIHSTLIRTEQKQDETLLQQSEMNYHDLADSIGEIFLAINSQKIITYCNMVALIVIGFDRDQIVGHSIEEFSLTRETGILDAVIHVMRDLKNETLVIKPTLGEINRYFEVNIYPAMDGVSILAKDITEQIINQWNLARYTSRLEGMREIDQQILMARKPDEVSHEAAHLLMKYIPCDLVLISSIDSEHFVSRIITYERKSPAENQPVMEEFPIDPTTSSFSLLQNGNPVIENKLKQRNDLEANQDLLKKLGYDSIIIAPMILEQQLVGTISLLSKDNAMFTDQDGKIAMEFAIRLAVAFRQAALNEETELRSRRLGALSANDIAITSSLDVRVTLSVILEQISTQLGVNAAAVYLYDQASGILTGSASYGFKRAQLNRLRLLLGEGLAGKAALNREVINYPDIRLTEDPAADMLRNSGENIVTYIAYPLLAKGQVKGVLELMHRSLLHPNEEWFTFMKTLATQASIAIDNAEMFDHLQRTNLDLSLAYDATIEGWSRAMELRGHEESGHSLLLADLTLQIAKEMGIPEEEWSDIRRGVLLHDIGMIGLPDRILLKTGPLTDKEFERIREHPRQAYDLLSPISYLRNALEIPYNHHEHFDGSGYPRGINRSQIPLSAQIFTIVDIWDALSSDRPYREAWSKEQIFSYLNEQSGKILNPDIWKTFMKLKF
jgi:HD-GYP domain-containing protein (c-di-GMP phosphodiesterase class II)/sensor domain CHASE-containing protein